MALTPSASILLRGGRASASSSSSAVGRPSCRASSGSSVGMVADGAVVGLRRLPRSPSLGARHRAWRHRIACDIPRRRGPRAMRGGLAAGAAVPGIVRRRLQPGARAQAGFAAVDRGIEQFGQRRPDRLHVGPLRLGIRRLGFRGFAGFFGSIRILRHAANMGSSHAASRKGANGIDAADCAACCLSAVAARPTRNRRRLAVPSAADCRGLDDIEMDAAAARAAQVQYSAPRGRG